MSCTPNKLPPTFERLSFKYDKRGNVIESASDGKSFVWNEDELLFENDTPQMRDRLGSPMKSAAFGVGKGNDPIGFTGYMYDDVSGIYFAQAREYMPQLGRFAGRDTLKGQIEMPHSINEYEYEGEALEEIVFAKLTDKGVMLVDICAFKGMDTSQIIDQMIVCK